MASMLIALLAHADSDNGDARLVSRVSRFYSRTSFWNQPVQSRSAIDPDSTAIMDASILPYVSRAVFSNGDDWGIGLAHASATDKMYTISCARFYFRGAVNFRIPKGATPTTGSDHHLVVIDGDRELDMWDASYNKRQDSWSAGSRFVDCLYGWGANALPGQHAGGAVAAGFSGMGGVVRPEEIAQGHIDHALSVMVPNPKVGYVGPASATDGTNTRPYAIPEGARIQLDPNFDVDTQSWPAWKKVLAKALQRYGAYVSDNGGTVAFYGQTDVNAGNMTWASFGVPKDAPLSDLPWGRIWVLNLKSVPASP